MHPLDHVSTQYNFERVEIAPTHNKPVAKMAIVRTLFFRCIFKFQTVDIGMNRIAKSETTLITAETTLSAPISRHLICRT